jgi:hypothetical protein
MFMSRARLVYVALGAAGVTLFAVLLSRARPAWSQAEWRRLRWLLVAALLALLPVAATFPADRLLLVPSIGGAAVAGALLHALWRETSATARWGRRALLVTQVLMPLPAWAASPWFLQSAATYVEDGVLSPVVSDAALAGRVVLVTGHDPLVGMYGSFARMIHGRPGPLTWHYLSYSPYPHRLTRVGEGAIELEVIGGRMLGTVMEQLFRAKRFPLEPGFTVTLDTMKVTVLESIEGQPTKVRADFTRPLAELTFVQWRNSRLEPLVLPPVGEALVLAHEPGPIDVLMDVVGGK